MKRRTQKKVVFAISGLVSAHAPALVGQALRDLAQEEDNTVVSGVLEAIADFAETEGPAAVDNLSEDIVEMIEGNPLAVMNIKSDSRYHTAVLLSDLADVLQDAEASDQRQAARMVDALGIVFADIGKVFASAVVSAI